MGNETHADALRWIVGLLESLGVPFQAVGGLAARAYGAHRPLNDLDFYVPTDRLADIAAAAGDRVVRPPTSYRDEAWDLTFMRMEYLGCAIELGGADGARLYDRQCGVWRSAAIDFSRSVPRRVLGVEVPTIPRDELVAYKRALGRDVDLSDLDQLQARG